MNVLTLGAASEQTGVRPDVLGKALAAMRVPPALTVNATAYWRTEDVARAADAARKELAPKRTRKVAL